MAQRAPHRSLGLLNGRYSAIAEPLVAPLQRRSATTGSSGQPSSAKGSEEVRDAIKGVVSKYVTFPDQAAAEDWIKFEMTDLSIKFKVRLVWLKLSHSGENMRGRANVICFRRRRL